jgi:formylglycine-generating enzyme required for sulfatase activity
MIIRILLWLLIGGLLIVVILGAMTMCSGERTSSEPPPTTASSEPTPGSDWTEPTTGMQFVWVPSGCFKMGSNERDDNQKPAHRVCVKGFYLGKYEVTQAEYEQIMGSNPCTVECNRFLGPDWAVTNVTWEDTQQMVDAMSQRTGNTFRLPSEAEWEYACLAGGLHKVYCGEGRLDDLAWIDKSHNGAKYDHPQEGGGKQPNAWGLFDMMGNVSEFVQDCWHGNYNGAPKDGSAWIADGYCHARVYRGGSWATSSSIKATLREAKEDDIHILNYSIGFRLVKVP